MQKLEGLNLDTIYERTMKMCTTPKQKHYNVCISWFGKGKRD